ncbi:phosphoglycerol transferase MdoB-like AlkP superfamily enzyme [Elusimicrobium simillimum]|uniref:LTA synthase family protein n=1 Tax=Elusimicrobium simillimum TaxID=3143438 RepID=UPI003C703E0A
MFSFLKKGNFKLKISIVTVGLFLCLFTLFRLAIFVRYHGVFTGLSGADILSSFTNGLRFDMSMIGTFAMVFVLLLNLPVKSKVWVKTFLIILATIFIIMAGTLVGDFIYFDYVKRHMAEELLVIASDVGFLVKYTLTSALIPLILLLASYGAAIFLIIKFVNKYYDPAKDNLSWAKTAAVLLVIAVVTVFGIRGRIFAHKTIGIGDVYAYASSPEEAALTLNGIFTSYHTLRKGKVEFDNAMPFDTALTIAKQNLITDYETVPNADYPLMRSLNVKGERTGYNFYVVLLEGWSPYYVDSLEGNGKFKVTPEFDAIVKDSVVFTNAYSAGLRSIFGFSGAFLGIPMLPGMPMLGYGLELSQFTGMGTAFNKYGYYTIFSQASYRDSYRMCALASGVIGTGGSYGREDMPEMLPYKEKAVFGFDYDALIFTADKLKNKKNFLALTFTAITHDPFTVTLPQFEAYPRGVSWENDYLNSLYYADYSVGELIKKAKTEGWFDNTIFIFLSDHSSGDLNRGTLKNRYRIPFVMYAPKILKPQVINHTVSQMDLLPTIYDLANISDPYAAFGKSALRADANRFAFFSEGTNIGIINDNGAIMHNGKTIVKEEADNAQFNAAQAADLALALEKASTVLIKDNKWFKQD